MTWKMGHMEMLRTANTILDQLGGQRRLMAMVGMKRWTVGEFGTGRPSTSFRFKGSKKSNTLLVTYRADDTYDVTFLKMSMNKKKTDFASAKKQEKFEGIYADMMIPLFEEQTGLYLTL